MTPLCHHTAGERHSRGLGNEPVKGFIPFRRMDVAYARETTRTELLDMGIEAFLVASAIVGVVSQRLLRKTCDNCKEPYTPGAEELAGVCAAPTRWGSM